MPDQRLTEPPTAWAPSPELVRDCTLTDFQRWVESQRGLHFDRYLDLWHWSITEVEDFWESIWRYFDVHAHTPPTTCLADRQMPGAQWFPGATINYAEHALRHNRQGPALIDFGEARDPEELSWSQLRGQVGAVSRWLTDHGVAAGDRVVGYLPSTKESVVAFLACAAIGAVWSSCAQEYSAQGAAARFGQLEPTVLVTSTGYRYGGKARNCRDSANELARLLPTLRAVLWVDGLRDGTLPDDVANFDDVVTHRAEPTFVPVPSDHPLWVLYSSGTTGHPKGLVHGHGGIILEHLKFLGLHVNVQPDTRFFWFATTSWMVWNVQVSGLLLGATIVVYDGSPTWPEAGSLWRIAQDAAVDVLGTSAAYLIASHKQGLQLGHDYQLTNLKTLGSTGSPLPASTYHWIHESLPVIWLGSTSGGTDIASAFAGAIPTEPVVPGEIQGPLLGVPLDAWDDAGHPVRDTIGELVVTGPIPSMPLYFWGDDGTRYHDSYFNVYPGIWRHGDWITITSRGTVIIHGRSDATINRHGVRIGSAEIYDTVERLPEVRDSLVVGIERRGGGYWMPLFVELANGTSLTPELVETIKNAIRTRISPRHVPDEIIQSPALPHTFTGKRLEIPVKRILQGAAPDEAADPASVDHPDTLAWFAELAANRNPTA